MQTETSVYGCFGQPTSASQDRSPAPSPLSLPDVSKCRFITIPAGITCCTYLAIFGKHASECGLQLSRERGHPRHIYFKKTNQEGGLKPRVSLKSSCGHIAGWPVHFAFSALPFSAHLQTSKWLRMLQNLQGCSAYVWRLILLSKKLLPWPGFYQCYYFNLSYTAINSHEKLTKNLASSRTLWSLSGLAPLPTMLLYPEIILNGLEMLTPLSIFLHSV